MQEFFTIRGRLRRRDYWGRLVGVYGVIILAYALASHVQYANPDDERLATAGVGLFILGGLIVANIQVIKRLHDTNLSGWWWFLFLLPVVNYGLSIGMSFVPGTRGQNRFGPDPKADVAHGEEQLSRKE